MNKKIVDLVEAAKGTIGEILTEDAIPALATEMLKGTVLEAASGAISAISPRIGGIMVAYQQKRWERNWETYIEMIVERQDEINERLVQLEQEKQNDVKYIYFPLISDYVPNEKQMEKLELIVNGFVNLTSGRNLQEDTVIMYYDTLEQLSILDIRILKLYIYSIGSSKSSNENIWDIMQAYQIDNSQTLLIKEKLARLGLLESKNDIDMDNNIREMSSYLESMQKGRKEQKLKLKRINKSESFKITSYGRMFLSFFSNLGQDETQVKDDSQYI